MANQMPHQEFFDDEASGEHFAVAPLRKIAQALVWMSCEIRRLRNLVEPEIIGLEVSMADDTQSINFQAKAKWTDGFVGFDNDKHQQPADWNVAFSLVVDSGENGGEVTSTGADTCTLSPGANGATSHVHAVYKSFAGDSIEEDWTDPAPSINGVEVDQV